MLNPFHFYSWGMWLPHRNCDTEFSCCKRFGALLICRAELSWAASYSGMYVYDFLFVVQVRFSTLMNDWMKSLTQYMECCLYDILLYKGNKSRGERARDFPVLGMPPDQLGVAFREVRGGESKIGMPRLPISFYSPQSPKSSCVVLLFLTNKRHVPVDKKIHWRLWKSPIHLTLSIAVHGFIGMVMWELENKAQSWRIATL